MNAVARPLPCRRRRGLQPDAGAALRAIVGALAVALAATAGADHCPSDLDGDGATGTNELLLVLSTWGPYPPEGPAPAADLDGDGTIGTGDVLALLANWGPCPPPPVVACCLGDFGCATSTVDECIAAGFAPGPPGSTCGGVDCAFVGACCEAEIDCVLALPGGCPDGMIFRGSGTRCDACIHHEGGACCLASGPCLELPAAECLAAGGFYQGIDTTCFDGCDLSAGVCCLDVGCAVLAGAACEAAGGIHLGPGAACADCEPITGACCFAFGPYDVCVRTSESACVREGGAFRGWGESCDACAPGGGACCAPSGECYYMTETDCAAAGGTFAGAGVTCFAGGC